VKMYGTRYGAQTNYAVAAEFKALADEVGVHPVTLAVAWVARHPVVTSPLIGARDVKQLEPALAAADFSMDDSLYERITALSNTPPPATDRNEEKTSANFGSR